MASWSVGDAQHVLVTEAWEACVATEGPRSLARVGSLTHPYRLSSTPGWGSSFDLHLRLLVVGLGFMLVLVFGLLIFGPTFGGRAAVACTIGARDRGVLLISGGGGLSW